MQDFAPFIPELLGALSGSQTTGHKGHQACSSRQRAVRINLPATFQFSPATSKSIDIPDIVTSSVRNNSKCIAIPSSRTDQ